MLELRQQVFVLTYILPRIPRCYIRTTILNPHHVCLHNLGLNMIKKRFIAGAVCKKCQQQDVIRWCKDSQNDKEWIECVSCGYHEDKPDEVMNAEHPQPSSDGIVNIVRFK